MFELEAKYLELQAEARALAGKVAPFADEADASSTVHAGMLEALRASGLSALAVPSRYGGRDEEVDPLAICVVREVLSGTSGHLDAMFAMQGIGSYAIVAVGTEAQRSEWLPRVARCEILPALALTEPDAGSDLRSLTASLEPSGDGLVLRGRKSFISNAGAASVYVVLARENDGLSLVLVPAATTGVKAEPTPELIAPHVLGELTFDDVALPGDARLGPRGEGMTAVIATLAVFRASVAGAAVGLAQAALDEAIRHACVRVQFGRPLIELQAVGALLVDSWAEIEMARLLTYRAAARARTDPAAALADSTLAKLAATEAAGRVVDRCMQSMGRFGLIRGAKIERLYRQARPMRIYEGASEAIRASLAGHLAKRGRA